MKEQFARSNGFNQEVQTVRARYPEIFENFAEFLEQEDLTERDFQKRFRQLCRNLQDDLSTRHRLLANPANEGTGGRLTNREETIRNDLRRNTYILVREFVGQKWWRYIEHLVQRKTPGRRAKSQTTKQFSDVLRYILSDHETGKLLVLDPAAIGDMANQLAYAQRHDVPFQFLIGFLAEVRFEQAAAKERKGDWEDWHPRSLLEGAKAGKPKAPKPAVREKADIAAKVPKQKRTTEKTPSKNSASGKTKEEKRGKT
jgi:hypothetical protein